MNSKISKLFKFLEANRTYNLAFQKQVLSSWILPFKTEEEKAYSLLLNVYQTQAHPGLDNARIFFESIYTSRSALRSFDSFAQHLGAPKNCNFQELFKALKVSPGWGKKTSALFIKMLFQLKKHKKLNDLQFWEDTPALTSDDRIFLPVDQVILQIFKYLDVTKNNFDKINSFLAVTFKNYELEIWDDLWFWGHFTQKGSGVTRSLEFNYGKYWINGFTNKTTQNIREIKIKCQEFIKLLTSQ